MLEKVKEYSFWLMMKFEKDPENEIKKTIGWKAFTKNRDIMSLKRKVYNWYDLL